MKLPDLLLRGAALLALAASPAMAQPAAPTRSTFQLARFWSKAVAELNMLFMFATRATFHEPMFAGKADAPLNMLAMFETDTTFHLLMSALNVVLLLKSERLPL